jgi:N-methylhydantoinase A
MQGVLVPPHPGILSAAGMILADLVVDYSQSIPTGGEAIDLSVLREAFAELMEQAAADVQLQGYEQDDCLLERQIDARYRGQSYELTVSADSLTDVDRLVEPFHRAHEQRFGHRVADRPVEIPTVRLRAIIHTPKPGLPTLPEAGDGGGPAALETMEVQFDERMETPIFDRDHLAAGHRIAGPAIVVETHATTLVPPDHVLEAHRPGHLTITATKGGSA